LLPTGRTYGAEMNIDELFYLIPTGRTYGAEMNIDELLC
jgi:hypothetical protein